MHSEKNGTTQRPRQQSGDSGTPAGRMVRALLGLPDNTAGGLRGQGPVPPVAFRYQMQPAAGEPSRPWPLSGRTPDRPADDMESVSALPDSKEVDATAVAPGHSPMVDRPAAGNAQRAASAPPAARTGERPLARPAAANPPRPGGDEAPRHARPQPPAPMMTAMVPVIPALSGGEKTRQPAKDSGQAGERTQAAAGQKEATPGGRQEMAIPGRSTGRQVFTALVQETSDHPAAADQPPAMPQASLPLHAEQTRYPGAARNKAHRSAHLSHGEELAQPPLDRRLTAQAATPMPVTAQWRGAATMAASHEPTPATGRKSTLPRGTAGKNAARGGAEEITAATPGRQPAVAAQQQEQALVELQAGERHTAVAPARQPDEVGIRQIEELRRTFYELVSKKTMATAAQDNGQTTQSGRETPQPPPLQQIVVINRTSGSRSRGRLPAAFWERSYMARTTLKMIR